MLLRLDQRREQQHQQHGQQEEQEPRGGAPLPWRAALLKGLLASDLVGLQTHGYARHFHSSCGSLLGTQNVLGKNQINWQNRLVQIGILLLVW